MSGRGEADRGHVAALEHGEWQRAFDLLRALDEERTLAPDELEQLGHAAYGSGDLEGAITAWERLHADRVAARDLAAAAGAATTIAIYLMMDTGLMAPVRGWLTRAERLLEHEDETAVDAWIAVVRTYERLMCGDMEAARSWAPRAIEVGERHDEVAAATVGRVALARLRIFEGDVDEGLALLDDAAVTTLSGQLDALAAGMVYCELVCAMQGLAQYDRAEEWTEAMERWRRDNAFGGLGGRCRVHRAEILRLRGSCTEAEEEALHACDELRPWMRREFGWPLTELGTIRLRRGDLAGAEEAFLGAHEHGWDPQPGLALLRLAQGNVVEAAASIRHALDHPLNVPSKERPPNVELRRAPLLDAQVEIAAAAGDPATAGKAAAELTGIAERFRSRALVASAALARGRVARCEGDDDAATRECTQAVAAWSEVGAPYEAARARLVLAEAHRARGNEESARLELRAARRTLRRVGAQLHLDELDETPEAKATPSTSSVFRLDGDTRTITFDGRSILLRDLKGMRYLARLLAEPGREFHVMDVVAVEQGVRGPGDSDWVSQELPATRHSDAGPMLDSQAKEAYRRRLAEIEDDIDEATALGDTDRVALAAADRDYLVRELARAVGLGGRQRMSGSTSERARASVTRALRYALARIAEHHPSLGDHLEQTIRTGTYCCYLPDPRVPTCWETERARPTTNRR